MSIPMLERLKVLWLIHTTSLPMTTITVNLCDKIIKNMSESCIDPDTTIW